MMEIRERLPITTRYTRAVHIAHDFRVGEPAQAGYQATPLVLQTLSRILDGLHPNATNRAFSITGIYGTGKSAFGLFLAHYMHSSYEERQRLLEQHSTVAVFEGSIYRGDHLLPVLISGTNRSLRQSVLQTLATTLNHQTTLSTFAPDLWDSVVAAMHDITVDAQYVADLVEQVNQTLADKTSYAGILILIDELGQYLDYAFREEAAGDLFVLQALADMAARSGDTPCVLVTILHQAFDSYAPTAGAAQRTDWKKVQGRFEDVPFQEPDSQMVRMIGQALCPAPIDQVTPERQDWVTRCAAVSEALGLRPPGIHADEWRQLLAQTYPLHPLVLVLLPLLFRQLAQNERSLFSFLTSHEPWGLPDVLAAQQVPGHPTPIYRLSDLYTYVEATMGMGIYTRSRGRRWAELAESLARLRDPDLQTRAVLTTIGLLNAFGQQQELRASPAVIAFALHDTDMTETVAPALQHLTTDQLITYRHHRDSYVLWEGSDLDLDTLVREALRQVGDRTDLAPLLQRSIQPVPLVARRHSYHTGAVRHFTVHFVTVDTTTTFVPPLLTDDADGQILYLVPVDTAALTQAEQWVCHPDRTHAPETCRIVVVPHQVQRLQDLLLEVTALQQVLATQPELEYDRVARRELASRLAEAQHALQQAIDWAYAPGHGTWWWQGERQPVATTRAVDALLSQACDRAYCDVPRIWNELIIRRQLSSASAKARRNLVEAMLEHGHEPHLALTGYPPERAMYESVFQASGIHRERDGQWGFGPPDEQSDPLHVQPVWTFIQHYFDAAQDEPRPVLAVFQRLTQPPYGVKAGLVPLLFMAVYLANAGEVTLYKNGNYVLVPDITVFEQLLRHPNHFNLRQHRAGGARMAIYERLAQRLAQYALTKAVQPALLDAINPLLRLARRLPEYTQFTQHISPTAQAIRHALLAAREPDITLFETLPRACGVAPFAAAAPFDEEQFETFFTVLRNGLMELEAAYPTLLTAVTEQIRTAFGAATDDSLALRQELTTRCQQIISMTADHQIRTLGIRLTTANEGDAWIESVGALVAQKPMIHWRDDDHMQFDVAIRDLGERFCQTERVAILIQRQQETTEEVTSIPRPGAPSVSLPAHPGMRALYTQITTVLADQETALTDAQRVQVLWDVLTPLLARTTERNDT